MQCPVCGLLQWAMSKKALCWNALALSLALALAGCSHEGADWKSATAADTRDAYEQFLTQHADSTWAQEARIRIENFAQSNSAAAANAAAAAKASAPAEAAAKAAATPPSMATGGYAKNQAASNAASQYVQLGAFSS